jgi:hypothetical protein
MIPLFAHIHILMVVPEAEFDSFGEHHSIDPELVLYIALPVTPSPLIIFD